MTVAAGARLGPYEIQSALGAGGMGEVYRATDTRLHRTVAIKILPQHVAADPSSRERFEREARAISSLEHPHICPLYDVGDFEGTPFLVMQFLDGETLAQRLERGALSMEEALAVGGQILEALDAAHRAGIIHRDLKPANIFLVHRSGPSGPPDVRLLDFGLAKKSGAIAGGALSMLPTTPPELTAQGTILGTFQYMAPEQLEGDEADARTDIFAFGAVLYEMVTGRRAFQGRTQASLIAAILDREPPSLSTVQPLAPPALERIVQRCLAKNREDRWQTVRDLLAEIQWVRTAGEGSAAGRSFPRRPSPAVVVATSLLVALTAIGFISWSRLREPEASLNLFRFQVLVPPIQSAATPIAVSPDGKRLVYASLGTSGSVTLWAHSLESGITTELTSIRQPSSMAWAPDSRRIVFESGAKVLQVLDLDSGALQPLFDLTSAVRGTSWGPSGIVFASDTAQGGAMFHVAQVGASPRMLFERPNAVVSQPQLVEDGRAVMYLMTDKNQRTHVCVAEIDGVERACLEHPASSIGYSPTGHLLFSSGSTVFGQQLDLRRVVLNGEPITLATDVGGFTRPYWAVSSVGSVPVLAYFPATARVDNQFAWFDRSGARLREVGEPAAHSSLDLSDDGRFIIARRVEPGGQGTFLIDAARGMATRASPPRPGGDVVWSPDGRRYARHSGTRLFEQATFGGNERVIFEHPRLLGVEDWSSDGAHLLVEIGEGTGRAALAVPVAGGSPIRVATSTGLLDELRFSPDGKWIAYNTDESGRHEVYIAPFAGGGTGERWPVSSGGGVQPRWRGDGRELYYLTLDGTLMSVDFGGGSPPRIGTAIKLFDTELAPTYNLDHLEPSRDGTRFLLRVPAHSEAQSRFEVVLNWTSLLPQ